MGAYSLNFTHLQLECHSFGQAVVAEAILTKTNGSIQAFDTILRIHELIHPRQVLAKCKAALALVTLSGRAGLHGVRDQLSVVSSSTV